MKKVFLIAVNHLRDQRWILLTMFSYAFVMSGVMGFSAGHPSSEDTRFFVEQQMWFAVLFSVFLATAAVNTDMRTRRILAILSKAVERWQYLLGISTGISMAIGGYCAFVSVLGYMLSSRAGHTLVGIVPLAAEVLLAAIAVASVGLFFGLLLPPLFATTATFGYLTVVPVLAVMLGGWIVLLSPVAFLLVQTVQKFHGIQNVTLLRAVLLTAAQALFYFLLSLMIFLKRDLARPTE